MLEHINKYMNMCPYFYISTFLHFLHFFISTFLHFDMSNIDLQISIAYVLFWPIRGHRRCVGVVAASARKAPLYYF